MPENIVFYELPGHYVIKKFPTTFQGRVALKFLKLFETMQNFSFKLILVIETLNFTPPITIFSDVRQNLVLSCVATSVLRIMRLLHVATFSK